MTIHDHDWSHVTHDLFRTMTDHIWSLLMTIKDYHSWLSSMTMNSTYEHHLWPSDLMTYDSSPVSITQDCYPWLSSMTMPITHDYAHHMTYHSWPWLPPMTMTVTHDYDCHPWLWISLTIYHHSWLAYITRDYHLCMSPMTVTDPLSLVMTTYHPWHSSHKIITHDHDYHSSLMTMTSYSQLAPMPYHSCLIIHVLSLMSIYDHHDLWLMIYNSSLVTITSDHHSWPSFMTIRSDHLTSHPWLLTHGY